MNTLKEFIRINIAFFTGAISYPDYHKLVRQKNMLILQYIIIAVAFLVMGYFNDVPLPIIVGGLIILAYGTVLQSFAKTTKQYMFYAFIWAVTSFIALALILFISVSLGLL